jgi:hypothetical protein
MRLFKPTLIAVAAALALPTLAQAGSITCPGAIGGDIERNWTLTTAPGTATCAGSGSGANDVNGSANDFFTSQGWLAVDKDPETAANETAQTDAWFTVTGILDDSGTITIDAAAWLVYSEILVAFKSGSGQLDPSWVAFALPFGETFGTWFTTPTTGGAGVSHVTFYARQGTQPCTVNCEPLITPEPGTLLMFGTGLALLAARLRRRKA